MALYWWLAWPYIDGLYDLILVADMAYTAGWHGLIVVAGMAL
jgi:hypothetical protein